MRPLLLCALACAVSAQTPGGWITINGQPTNVTGREVAVLDRGARLCYSFPASVTFDANGEQLCYGFRPVGDTTFAQTCTTDTIQRGGCINMQGNIGPIGINAEILVRSGHFPDKQVRSATVNVLSIAFPLTRIGVSTDPAKVAVLITIAARRMGGAPTPNFSVDMYDKDSRAVLNAPLAIDVGTDTAVRKLYTFTVPKSNPTKGPYTMRVFVGSNRQVVLQTAPLEPPTGGWGASGI